MEYFSCPGSPVRWSRIALGCWQIAPSDGWGKGPPVEQAQDAVLKALDCGITTFDTAEGYGDGESERRLGRALGSRINDVAIISKIWPDAALKLKAFEARLDQSLRNLGRDYVDLYLMHFPGGAIPGPAEGSLFCEIMQKLKDSGKARLVGLSNFEAGDLCKLSGHHGLFSSNEVCYNLLEREYEGENLRASREHGLEYLAYSPLAQGILTGRFGKGHVPTDRVRQHNELYREPKFSRALKVVEVLRTVAGELSATTTQVALAWCLAQPNIRIAIVGSKKAEQIEEASGAGDLKLSADQLARLTAASDEFLRR